MTEPIYNRAALAAVYLPVGQMLQIDRVIDITEDRIASELDLEGHWVFPMHFPNDPIFPACLTIEAAGQVIAIWAWHHQLAGLPRLARVKGSFEAEVRPSDGVLSFSATIKQRRHICFGIVEVFAKGKLVAKVEETLVVVSNL